jgi:hypothetical protein
MKDNLHTWKNTRHVVKSIFNWRRKMRSSYTQPALWTSSLGRLNQTFVSKYFSRLGKGEKKGEWTGPACRALLSGQARRWRQDLTTAGAAPAPPCAAACGAIGWGAGVGAERDKATAVFVVERWLRSQRERWRRRLGGAGLVVEQWGHRRRRWWTLFFQSSKRARIVNWH